MKDRFEELHLVQQDTNEDRENDEKDEEKDEIEEAEVIPIEELEENKRIETEKEEFLAENELENEIVIFLVDVVLMDEQINTIANRYG